MPEDYIMRLLRQIAAVLAGIMAKKEAGKMVEARQDVESTCLLTIGMSLAQLKQLAPEAVAKLVNDTGASRHLRAITLAELLLLDLDLSESGGHPTSNHVHAFCLIADTIDALGAEEQAVYRVKLNLLSGQLGELREHPYIKARLRDFGVAGKS